MTIFVHRASECLTDHLSHGEGLICFSLLGELCHRGHTIFAYTNRDGVDHRPKEMTIRVRRHRVLANSLSPWEHGWRADRWLRRIERRDDVDLVWRMPPFGGGCPTVPYTGGRPLVVGPIFYDWPKEAATSAKSGHPRLGLGIGPLVAPLANRGWRRTLRAADLVLCATQGLASQIAPRTAARVEVLPCIVEPPPGLASGRNGKASSTLRLLFVANLHPNKRPLIFCETIQRLRQRGIDAVGIIIGEGEERANLEQWCRANQLDQAVRFLGRISNSEVYQHMAGADGLVSSSLGEPYGRAVAEAMSVGVVPICHRSGGPADFIAHDVNGLLVDRLDSADYADAIAAKWTDPSAWRRLSAAAVGAAPTDPGGACDLLGRGGFPHNDLTGYLPGTALRLPPLRRLPEAPPTPLGRKGSSAGSGRPRPGLAASSALPACQHPVGGPALTACKRTAGRGEAEPAHQAHQDRRQRPAPASRRGPPSKAPHRGVVGEQHPVRAPVGGGSLDVEDLARGLVADRPTGLARPPAQVDVLHVHEVGRVKAP